MADSKKKTKKRSKNDRPNGRASGKELTADELEGVVGGVVQAGGVAQQQVGSVVRNDGSLDAGIHFKYDLKAQKEA